MTPERWRQVKQTAGDALDVAPTARGAFLEQACAGDPELYAEVASLLADGDPGGAFLEPDPPPDRVGVYRIVREIGRGGMGTVYLAERADHQFDQRVAIKVVKRGMDSAAVVRRFFAERQILARLQHPHIARLLDGGMTSDGRPYVVMEYVDGQSIVAACRRKAYSVPQRLALFLVVCDAVEHAHSHLVLHRDIKPENILVDESGSPRLLDFGIAKLLDGDTGAGVPTEIGQRVMTPQFGSPEQLRGEPLTTASDTYALGLLLYELLTNCRPYDMDGRTPAEQARIVSEVEPRRPSEVAAAADARQIRGDLDKVVLKALEKDPARRYARAADLADDLRRFQQKLPVSARPASLGYKARKYGARHWRGLAIAALLAAVVAAAMADALIQGRRAERHFNGLRQLANSFLFEFHDAIAKLPGATPARELVVTRALQYLDGLSREAAGDVGLKRELAESYLRVGDVQGLYFESNLGKTRDARASFEKALALFTDVLRARPSDLQARTDVANATLRLSSTFQATDPPRALALIQEAIRLLPDRPGPGADDRRAQSTLGLAYTGMAENRVGSAAASLQARNRAIEIFRGLVASHPGDDNATRMLSQSLKRRAALLIAQQSQAEGAEKDLAEAAAIDEQRLERDPSSAVAALDLALGESYLSAVRRRKGELDGAVQALERAMELRQRIVRADPQNVRVLVQLLGDHAKLAALHRDRRDAAAARATLTVGLQLAATLTGPAADNPDIKDALAELRSQARRP